MIPKIKEIITNKFSNSKINCHLDPKEVVAMGAAIRGAISLKLSSIEDIQLFDVTNLSLGIKEHDVNLDVLIKRSTKLPCEKIKLYQTDCDNQTFVWIEIYEGEDKAINSEKNLLLGKFKIVGLPKRKKGGVKISVKFRVNENSILEVTAWEKENEMNKGQIKIEKLCNLDLDSLINRVSHISFVENQEYNQIKFEIIELEEKINKQKTQEKMDVEAVKSLNKNLLLKIGNFLKETQDKSNLFISFIKYYFDKICEFYQDYNEKSNDDINDFNKIKENIKVIFEKIQFINPELIYEIIEEFVDLDNLYTILMDFLLSCYYSKTNEIFLSAGAAKKDRECNVIEKAIKELSEGIKIAEICIGIIDKYKLNSNNSINLNLRDFENIKLKMKVRRKIIKYNNKSIIKKIFTSKKNLNNLYNQYYACEFHDKDDLQELKILTGQREIAVNDNKVSENFEEEFQNAIVFNEWITQKTSNFNESELSNIITRILTDYPYCPKKEEDKMWDNFDLFKSQQMKPNRYILMLRGKYQKLLNNDETNDIKKQVYDNILIFLNSLN